MALMSGKNVWDMNYSNIRELGKVINYFHNNLE